MTPPYMWHDSFACVTWLNSTCDMTHSYAWYDSSIHATCRIPTRDINDIYVLNAFCWQVSSEVHPLYTHASFIRKRYLRITSLFADRLRARYTLSTLMTHSYVNDIYVLNAFCWQVSSEVHPLYTHASFIRVTSFIPKHPKIGMDDYEWFQKLEWMMSKNWKEWLWIIPKIRMNDVQKLEGMIMNYSKNSNDLNLWYDVMCDMT